LALELDGSSKAAELLLSLGELLLRLNRHAEAAPPLTIAAELFKELGDARNEGRSRIRLLGALNAERGTVPYDELVRLNEIMAENAAVEGDTYTEGAARHLIAKLLAEQAAVEDLDNGP
jgi:hypothetical protein